MKKQTLIILILFPFLVWASQQEKIFNAKQKVFPALVHIQPVKELNTGGQTLKVQVTGSGVIISADGYVVTNNHVAEKANLVRCTLSSRHEVKARVVGLDPHTDLAVLKLDLKEAGLDSVPYAQFGNSSELEVGQMVIALGSPLGLSRSLSVGVVSSVDRYFNDVGEMISPYNLWIQTDAAINPGNSGGPLVDLNGSIVGINARAVPFGENLGFAIPANIATHVTEQIIKSGVVQRAKIGISWQEIKEYRAYKNNPNLQGVLVSGLEKNAPAALAGIKVGDIVYKINDKNVSAIHLEELPKVRLFVANLPVNSDITFKLISQGKHKTITVKSQQQGKFKGTEYNCEEWGISVEEITTRIRNNFRLTDGKGVLVSSVKINGKGSAAGIIGGHILRSINGNEIEDLQDFKQIYTQLMRDKSQDNMLFLSSGKDFNFVLMEGDTHVKK